MKKAIIIIICVFFAYTIKAQEKNANRLRLGLKISPSFTWLNNNTQDFSSESVKLKLAWGLVLDVPFAENYFFSTGIDFKTLGGKINYPFTDDNNVQGILKRDFSLKFAEIPLCLKLKTNEFGSFTFFGQIGTGFGLKLKANSDDYFTVSSSTQNSVIDKDASDDVNFFRVSLIVSLGTEYKIGKTTSLFCSLNYNNGFTNIFNFKSNVTPYSSADATSNTAEITLGVMF